ncbi:hypothetical protein, partial [Streptomyces sp. NPDC056670]|uniref:hypothetical protein n=1 Tax=Streptomyces sp. NPDC056670 TaxID=3345904 RepID=UPI00369F1EDB
MTDPAAQSALEAEIAKHAERTAADSAAHADNAAHRDAWRALTREERTTRTLDVIRAGACTLGATPADGRPWFTVGNLTATVPDGRLYIEQRRDDTATLTAARDTLTAAGWTLTDHGTHFYATPPQTTPAAPMQLTDWERDLIAVADTLPAVDHEPSADRNIAEGDTPADHATTCPVYADGLTNDMCDCHYSDAQCEAEQATATPVAVEWIKTVKGHHNGTARINGTTYKITHIAHARRAPGAMGSHIARTHTPDGRTGDRVALTWDLPTLLADIATHAGITGPLTVTETGRDRLTHPRRGRRQPPRAHRAHAPEPTQPPPQHTATPQR